MLMGRGSCWLRRKSSPPQSQWRVEVSWRLTMDTLVGYFMLLSSRFHLLLSPNAILWIRYKTSIWFLVSTNRHSQKHGKAVDSPKLWWSQLPVIFHTYMLNLAFTVLQPAQLCMDLRHLTLIYRFAYSRVQANIDGCSRRAEYILLSRLWFVCWRQSAVTSFGLSALLHAKNQTLTVGNFGGIYTTVVVVGNIKSVYVVSVFK